MRRRFSHRIVAAAKLSAKRLVLTSNRRRSGGALGVETSAPQDAIPLRGNHPDSNQRGGVGTRFSSTRLGMLGSIREIHRSPVAWVVAMVETRRPASRSTRALRRWWKLIWSSARGDFFFFFVFFARNEMRMTRDSWCCRPTWSGRIREARIIPGPANSTPASAISVTTNWLKGIAHAGPLRYESRPTYPVTTVFTSKLDSRISGSTPTSIRTGTGTAAECEAPCIPSISSSQPDLCPVTKARTLPIPRSKSAIRRKPPRSTASHFRLIAVG